jgi:hypothetical protein
VSGPPLPWFSFRDREGRAWRVRFSCANDKPDDLELNWGVTHLDTREIVIDASMTRHRQVEVLLHEILHVAMDNRGTRMSEDEEEEIVQRLTPRLLPILCQLRFRAPRRPRGMALLERLAREDEEE